MKKEYIEPQMQAVSINNSVQLLSGSGVNGISSNVFDGTFSGSSGYARAPIFDDLEELFDE